MFNAVTGTNGNDFLQFQGQLGQFTAMLVNPYSGFSAFIDEELNINTGSYDGLGGFDSLVMTNVGDGFFINDGSGNSLLKNIEVIQAGDGGDVIFLADDTITIADITVNGAASDDIIWGNVGNDILQGFSGNDHIDGGPGNDWVLGGGDNDILIGHTGADYLQAGTGNDLLHYSVDAAWGPGFTPADLGSTVDALTGFSIDGYNQTHDVYDGGSGYDVLQMTAGNDSLFLNDAINPVNPNSFFGSIRVLSLEEIQAGDGDDLIDFSTGSYTSGITIYGDLGADILSGSDGNDVLYGGNGVTETVTLSETVTQIITVIETVTSTITVDKEFSDSIVFPGLQEGVNITNLLPPGDPSLGVVDGNLNANFDAQAELTFRKGFAGYNNSLGVYSIAEDGTIEMASLLWENVKDAGKDVTHVIDIPHNENTGDFGFFILANGDRRNDYNDLDTGAVGNIQFIYDFGGANERAATVFDNGQDITVVYDDGTIVRALDNAPVYHTTERDGTADLNPDGKKHVVSGLMPGIDGETGDVFRIGFEDLPMTGDADYEDVLFDLDIIAADIEVTEEIEVEKEVEVVVDVDVVTRTQAGDDLLIGGAGNDTLYGEGGDDILIVGLGLDMIYGDLGNDTIVFDAMDADMDMIFGFRQGGEDDVIDISDILDGFDSITDDILDFVALVDDGNGNTEIHINNDGDAGGTFAGLAIIDGGVGGDTVADLISAGSLIV